jgi:hypothetical protein
MQTGVEEVRAILAAYRQVKNASWPKMHAKMAHRHPLWPTLGEAELRAELNEYLAESSAPSSGVRVFWKLGNKYVFGGCNEHFAKDAGLKVSEILGTDDFDRRLPWQTQADKYRADDSEVFTTGTPKLDILERQTSSTGAVTWVRVGKTPIKTAAGAIIGIFGMYELLDDKAAKEIVFARNRAEKAQKP